MAHVIVIGAGCAGLAAASTLAEAGVGVSVVEAREHVGGRVRTLHPPRVPAAVELGAEFVHGLVPEVLDTLREAALPAVELAGSQWQAQNGRLHRRESFFEDVRRVTSRFERDLEPDVSVGDFLRQRALDRKLPEAVPLALRYVEGFHAADPELMSARALARAEAAGGGAAVRTFRVVPGYDTLPATLAAGLPEGSLYLSSVVDAVHWQPGRVRVQIRRADGPDRRGGTREHLEGDAAIITLPVSLLAPGAAGLGVAFEPPLEEKAGALAGLAMGTVVRVALAFDDAFWETEAIGGLDGAPTDMRMLHTPDATFNVFWTAYPLHAPLLIAWAGGPRAERLARDCQHRTDMLASVAVRELATAIGASLSDLERRLRAEWHHPWETDPFSLGAYSYPRIGGADAGERLAQPLSDTLFFAGEATAPLGRNGTVDGAIGSGRRAAREILGRLQRTGG